MKVKGRSSEELHSDLQFTDARSGQSELRETFSVASSFIQVWNTEIYKFFHFIKNRKRKRKPLSQDN